MKSNTIATIGTLLMITLFMASFAFTGPDLNTLDYQQDRVAFQPADKPERPPPRRGHHPPPPGIPPTVLFLIGGALGYLIGRKGHRPPPPPPPHHFERT